VYIMKSDEIENTPNMVTSTFSIHSYPVTVLVNFGTHHSFVTSSVINKLKLGPFLDHLLYLLLDL